MLRWKARDKQVVLLVRNYFLNIILGMIVEDVYKSIHEIR